MQIDHNILSYLVISEDSILSALTKISRNKNKIVFSVDESGILKGVITDGDFRRWLLKQKEIDLNLPVSAIQNKTLQVASIDDQHSDIEALFTHNIRLVPLVDQNRRIVGIAKKNSDAFHIGDIIIGDDYPTFIIAEIGNNHNGSLELARKLVDAAVLAGANCAKFQMRDLETLYRNSGDSDQSNEDLGSQYTFDLLSRFQLKSEEMFDIFNYCHEKQIIPLCTPWDLVSLNLLEKFGMKAYKLASADLTNHELIQALLDTCKPLICSTGMSTEEEIFKAVDLIKQADVPYILLHCNSTYPAPFKDIHLSYMAHLKDIGGGIVGYSGHERGYFIPIAAVSLGAKVIEKHFTLDRSMEGNDHKVSLIPDEFTAMVKGIREVEEAMGKKQKRSISQGEMINREVLGKSLSISCDLKKGEKINGSMLKIVSPGQGLPVYRKNELVGRKAQHDFKTGDFFFPSDIGEVKTEPRAYKFNRPWGLPVRYHDAVKLLELTNPTLFEFHLSYRDLELDISKVFSKKYDIDFMVHCPELFPGDHILDLSSPNDKYRERSIEELQRVINSTLQLKSYFPSTACPLIIVNVGGASQNSFEPLEKKKQLYERLCGILESLDTSGVELIPQTMPPFPWHFGGQRCHNLFIDPDEIVEFCENYNYRVCFDISHSYLACNHFKWSFKDFVVQVAPFTAHLHIADAKGVDDEGLQVGDGEIDFSALSQWLLQFAPKASFIPEVWQGHKNDGEGFWKALDRLEKVLE